MIWNRDTNACRNILNLAKLEVQGEERPLLFTTQLPDPPILFLLNMLCASHGLG